MNRRRQFKRSISAFSLAMILISCTARNERSATEPPRARPDIASPSLDLRQPMLLGARAIANRLDPNQKYRPWFLIRGTNGIPAIPEHASWDLGDMTGRYLESLI